MICRLPKSLLPVQIMAKKKKKHATCGMEMWPRFVTVGQSMELRFQHLPHNSRLSASLLPPQRAQCICSRLPSHGWHSAVMLCILISFFFHHYICCCNLHFTLANCIHYLAFYNIWPGSQSTEIQSMHLKKSVFSKKFPLWGLKYCRQNYSFYPSDTAKTHLKNQVGLWKVKVKSKRALCFRKDFLL